jgi:signal transduction histidine kinase
MYDRHGTEVRQVTQRPKTGRSRLGVQSLAGWLRDRRIGIKLGFIMFIPTVATVIVGANGLVGQISNATTADRARTMATLSSDAGSLVQSLQDERADAAIYLGTLQSKAGGSAVSAAKTVYNNQLLKSAAAQTDYQQQASATSNLPASVRSQLTTNTGLLAALGDLHKQIVGQPTDPNAAAQSASQLFTAAISQYNTLISKLLTLRDYAAQLAGDPALSFEMRAAGAIAQAKEFVNQERVAGIQAVFGTDHKVTPAELLAFYGGITGAQEARTAYAGVSTPAQQLLLTNTVTGDVSAPSSDLENAFAGAISSNSPLSGFTPAQWNAAMSSKAGAYRAVETALDKEIITDATARRDAVERAIIVDVALLFAIVLLAMLIAWLVARSMNRSLRELKHGALTVARQGLPQAVARLRDPNIATQLSPQQIAAQIAEPLPVRSKDEFGEVTEAFNAVHIEAVRTAAEQAVLRSSVATMFVNLARRSQILVDRLIGHLDRLERGEEDPDRLAELFQLDHLATRMRRNDENLLVLAGADSTRVQREPAPLVDVLRAAQSEVEHYTRIEFGSIDRDLEIASHAVNDLVHLIAELLDNATAFSPPDSPVLIEARRFGDRAVLYVEDRGIGISGDQLADLNDRLAKPPLVDVAVSRMMGLVVVARLAARHGIEVKLRPAADRGTVADVLLPAAVLVNAATYRTAPPMAGAERAALKPEPAAPPVRSPFGPPLALESGPSAAERTPASAGTSSAAPANFAGAVPGGIPAAAADEFGGFAASAERFGTARPESAGPGSTGRQLPSWSDLTGASGLDGQRRNGGYDGGGYTGSGYTGERGYGNGYNGAPANGTNGFGGRPGVPTAPLPRRASLPDGESPVDESPFGAPRGPFEPSAYDDGQRDDRSKFGPAGPGRNGAARAASPFGPPPFESAPGETSPFDDPAPETSFRVPRQRPQGLEPPAGFAPGDGRGGDGRGTDAEPSAEPGASSPIGGADQPGPHRPVERPAPTSAPPAWPPVSAQPALNTSDEPDSSDQSSGRVESLDMTAEIPRFRDLDLAAAMRTEPADEPAGRGDAPRTAGRTTAPESQLSAPVTADEATATPVTERPNALRSAPEMSRSTAQPQVMPFADETMELPIFKAVESAWFAATGSSSRHLMARQSDVATADPSHRPPSADTPSSREVPQPRVAEVPVEARTAPARPGAGRRTPVRPEPPAPPGRPVGYPERPDYRTEPGYQPETMTGGNQMAGSATSAGRAPEQDWHTSADDGWLAAEAASQPVDGGVTPGGLPRRVPLAQLVPGSVERTATGSNRRSPDAVRGLLSAYHRGVQRGRQQTSDDSPASSESTSGRPTPGGKEQDK